jgi:Fic/DOC family
LTWAACGCQQARYSVTLLVSQKLAILLVRGTPSESGDSGAIRGHQVVIGQRTDVPPGTLPVHATRFVPSPPGLDLRANLQAVLEWMNDGKIAQEIDPVVAAALVHYRFETLHPFPDGNGRIGRFLIVVHLLMRRVYWSSRRSPCRRGSKAGATSITIDCLPLALKTHGTNTCNSSPRVWNRQRTRPTNA